MSKFNQYLEKVKDPNFGGSQPDNDDIAYDDIFANIKNSLEDLESQKVKITLQEIKEAVGQYDFSKEYKNKAITALSKLFDI